MVVSDFRESLCRPEVFDPLRRRLNAALRGKADVIELVLQCLAGNGHLLLEDLPGLGKTTLARSLATGLGGRFSRCQCTPDLLPSDITGFSLYNQKSHEFEFREGPVFADILLADELNRATPRTQSALLEAMAERQVTVDGRRYSLSPQFMVIATQNPVDQHGTYPLPEAQLDRFSMKLSIGYPSSVDESQMLLAATAESSLHENEGAVLSAGQLATVQKTVARITAGDAVRDYLVRLAGRTRGHASVSSGLSPRGLLIWQRMSQSRAWLSGRDYVTPDDVQDTAFPVLSVRLGLETSRARVVVEELIESTSLPEYR
jgi:MoxR-like ATPase